MTAPAQSAPRTERPPTRAQLMILADRAERGPLTAAEADRLRQGIAAMDAGRRSTAALRTRQVRALRTAAAQFAAVQRLVARAQRLGAHAVPLRDLEGIVQPARRPARAAKASRGPPGWVHGPNAPQALAQPFVTRNHPDTYGAFMYPTLFTTPGLKAFAEELDAERGRQLAKFGDQRHPDGTGRPGDDGLSARARRVCEKAAANRSLTWRQILHEEVREALAESDPAKLRAELIQVAAVCAAWVSDLDQRPTPVELRAGEQLPPDLEVTATGDPWDETYKPALCGCGNPTHSPLTACPPPVRWTACTPEYLALHPGACQTALRLPGDGVSVAHFHARPDTAEES
ncbi:hypothetical protein ACFWIB_15405 [Streptomyces sp. NPDC127051]|uniref:hypothetical protein n=1 Tax=Streptomyces sp. NPDC127051 TaxID=3347119 RepID=UPI0036561D49